MYYSASDSDQGQGPKRGHSGQESETEAQLLAEQNAIQLAEEKTRLLKENNELRAQFEHACQFAPQLEELTQQNRKLKAAVRNITAEKEDFAKRLEISQKVNDELAKKVDAEKQSATHLHNQDLDTSKKEVLKIKQQAKAQVNNVYSQLENLQKQKDQSDLEIKVFKNKIDRLLENASRYFEGEFSNIEDLSAYLAGGTSQPSQSNNNSNLYTTPSKAPLTPTPKKSSSKQTATPLSTPRTATVNNFNNESNEQLTASYERKIRHLRSSNKNLTTAKDELEANIARLQRELKEVDSRHQNEVNQLNNQIKQKADDQALSDAETKHTIITLQSKCDALKEKVEDLKKKNNQQQQQINQQQLSQPLQIPSTPVQQGYASPMQPLPQQGYGYNYAPQNPQYNAYPQNPAFSQPVNPQYAQQSPFYPNSPHQQQQQQQRYGQTEINQSQFYPQSPAVSTPLRGSPQRSGISSLRGDNDLLNNSCAASDHLVNQNIDLNQQVKSLKNRNVELTTQLRESEAKIAKLEIALDKEKNDIAAISIVHKDTIAELEMLRNALHEKESVKDRSEKKLMRREFQAQKAQLQNMSKTVETQKQQLSEIYLEHQNDLTTISTLQRKIDNLQEKVKHSKEENKLINEQLTSAQAELETKQHQATPEQLIPAYAWQSSEFDSELNSAINKLGGNQSLQPASKIQHIYKSIAKHFKKQVVSRDKALDEAFSENQEISNAMNQFLVNLSITLEMEPITFNDFFTKHPEQKIFDTITNIRQCHDEVRKKNEQLSLAISRINQSFNAQSNNASNNSTNILDAMNGNSFCEDGLIGMESQVSTVKNQLSEANGKLAKRSKKVHDLSTELKILKKKNEVESEDAKTEIQRLSEIIESLQKENDELLKVNQKQKWEIQNQKTEFIDYKQMHEDSNEELKEKMDQKERQQIVDKQRVENELREQIRLISLQVNDTNDTLIDYQEEVKKLKKVIETQKAVIAEKESEIERINSEHEETVSENDSKFSTEKKAIVTSYEKTIAELRQQCEEHRLDVEKISKVLASTEKKLKQSKETVLQLKKDKIKQESDIKNQVEQFERQKKLAEAAAKVEILKIQTESNNKVDEEKEKIEEERRRIYGAIAENFKQFLSAGDALNERSFKTTIFRARDEIAKLQTTESAVRRIVNAESNQKTEDAVAQVVLKIA